jgi:hypothetical protein
MDTDLAAEKTAVQDKILSVNPPQRPCHFTLNRLSKLSSFILSDISLQPTLFGRLSASMMHFIKRKNIKRGESKRCDSEMGPQ